MDSADLLAANHAPHPTLRNRFIETVLVDAVNLFEHRVEDHERQLLRALLEECELPHIVIQNQGFLEVATVPVAQDIWSVLSGKRVGLYSLLEKGANRFKTRLLDLCPGVTVELNSDHDATAKLRNLAAGADYMIVDTAHAKHEATGAIDAVLSRDQQIFPVGKGVASFLLALKERLEEVAPPAVV